jgi:hypothetical protein
LGVTPVLFVVVVDDDDDDESDKSVTLGRNSSDGYFDRGLERKEKYQLNNQMIYYLYHRKKNQIY